MELIEQKGMAWPLHIAFALFTCGAWLPFVLVWWLAKLNRPRAWFEGDFIITQIRNNLSSRKTVHARDILGVSYGYKGITVELPLGTDNMLIRDPKFPEMIMGQIDVMRRDAA